MKPRHVAYLTSSEVVLYTWDDSHYVPVSGYELPNGDPTPLVSYLRQTPSAVIAILVDVLEEEHQQATIARLGRRDQRAMLARKLARAFPRTNYRNAAVQGRLPNEPQTARILLSGLTKAEHLGALLGLLAEAKLPVARVCSPALLSRPVVDKLRPASPADATLLVSRQREGSLRLTFYRDRNLVGSRLIRRSVAAAPGDIPRLVRQLEESVRYFDAAFAPSATNPVDVILLCEPGTEPAAALGTGHDGFRLLVPDPVTAAAKLGLGAGTGAGLKPGNADLLFVALLRQHAPAGDFAPPADRRYFELHRMRVFGRAACVLLAGGALLGSALNVADILRLTGETANIQATIGTLSRGLDPTSPSRDLYTADPLEMERIVRAWQLLEKHVVEPRDIFSLVSAAVDANPDIRVDRIEWLPLQAVTAATADSGSAADEQDGEPVESEAGTAATEPAMDEAGAATSSPVFRLVIRGHIQPFAGDYPLAFMNVRTFMQALRADRRVISVKAINEPLDLNPRSTLTGEVTADLKTEKAGFTLNILVRAADEPA